MKPDNEYSPFFYYSLFMAEELGNELGEFNPSQAAHEVAILLSVPDAPIPETFFRLYTDYLPVQKEILYNAVAYFCGSGHMSIQCDCPNEDKFLCDIENIRNMEFFDMGMSHSEVNDFNYESISQRITSLRADLL